MGKLAHKVLQKTFVNLCMNKIRCLSIIITKYKFELQVFQLIDSLAYAYLGLVVGFKVFGQS